MKNNALIAIVLIISSALFCFLWTVYHTPPDVSGSDTIITTKTDTIWKDTTIKVKEFVPQKVYIIKRDTFYTKEGQDTVIQTEKKTYQDTLCYQNDSIILKSYISGVNPTLDSIKADWRKSETIITNTVEITKYITKKKGFWDRFNIEPAVTFGYDPINKQLGLVVGIGGSFDVK